MKQANLVPILVLSAVLFAGSSMASAAPPQGLNYFITVMGLGDAPYDVEAACLDFDATHACVLDEDVCLTWERAEGGVQKVQVSGFTVEGELNDDGLVIAMDGQGRVEGRGRKSAIAVAARARDVLQTEHLGDHALGRQVNYVIAGRQVSRGNCRRLVDEFYEAQTAAQ